MNTDLTKAVERLLHRFGGQPITAVRLLDLLATTEFHADTAIGHGRDYPRDVLLALIELQLRRVDAENPWFSIATAPKQVRAFLVYCPELDNIYHVYRAPHFGEKFMFFARVTPNPADAELREVPSLWQPLPDGPVPACPHGDNGDCWRCATTPPDEVRT